MLRYASSDLTIYVYFTIALAFAKNGIKVDMLDSVLSAIDSTPEMAALVPINAQRVLNEMQCYEAISKLGQPLASFGLSDQTGKLYGSINYQELATVHGFSAVGMSFSVQPKTRENKKIR